MSFIKTIKSNNIFNSILSLGSATLLSAIFAFLVGIFTRNLLGPEQYGYWVAISIFFTFIPLLQFGILNAMNREIPFYLARNNHSKVYEIREITLSFLFTIPFFSMVLLFIVSIILLFFDIAYEYKTGLLFVSCIGLLMFFSTYVEMYYKSIQNFRIVSKLIAVKSISQAIFTLLSVYLIGYIGLFIGLLISLVIELLFGRRAFKNVKLNYNFKAYIELIKIGFPILMVGLIWSVLIASDKMIITLMMTPKDLGNYSVGLLVFSTMMLLPQVVGQIYYPKIVELVSQEKFIEIRRLYWKVNGYLAIIVGFIVIIGFWLLPPIISFILPDYVVGIKSAQILLLGIFPLTLVGFSANYFNATKNQKLYIKILIVTIVSNILVSVYLLLLNPNITSIALGTSISFLLYFLLMNIFFIKKINQTRI